MIINRSTQAADIIKADNLGIHPSSVPSTSLSGYGSQRPSLPSSVSGTGESAASTVQNVPSISMLGEGISLVSSGSQLFSSAMPSATTTPDLQGSPSASRSTLPPSFLSVFAPVPTVSESLLPTYSSTADASHFSNAVTHSPPVSSSELSTVPNPTQAVASPMITIIVTETAISIDSTEIGGAASASLGSSTLVLPLVVTSPLSAVVLTDSTSGRVQSLTSLCSNYTNKLLAALYTGSSALPLASPSTTTISTDTGSQQQQQWLQETVDSFINWLKSVLHMR